ncbi:hypothetical protein [Streptomyces sp. NBC_00687]|uniref:hypothetical protein n=1 Tax=Streptomyces sp. NBC_00687 TaxID=2975807 RepID=UPI002253CC27|nr:hypothetical protein [Streptomyces sp. NBC_00687]MCX4920211.1 hypothetical protein [Streptomyces sp. NBC_00687]
MDTQIWVMGTNGQWRQEKDPLAQYRHLEDWNAEAKAAGYVSWTSFPQPDVLPIGLEVYRGTDADPGPLFLVNVVTPAFYETVYAESAPALMDLLARWTPVVQGAAVSRVAGDLEDKDVILAALRALTAR